MSETKIEPQVRVFKPFKAGFPNFRIYLAQIWQRKAFIHELSLAERRLEHLDTVFGAIWTILSPMLMAAIYYLLVMVLQGGHKPPNFLVHLLAGVFIFNFISVSAMRCARSITNSGRLITNANFPRAILPLTQTWTSFLQLLPALAILLVAQVTLGPGLSWTLLWAIPDLAIIFIFAVGFGFLTATANVYFRDTAAALPYFNRVWTYASPVLYTADQVRNLSTHDSWMYVNPLFAPLEIWSGTIAQLQTFPLHLWLISLGGAVLFLMLGTAVFLYREGEFAVRV